MSRDTRGRGFGRSPKPDVEDALGGVVFDGDVMLCDECSPI